MRLAQQAFTMIELMITVSVLSIFLAIGIPALTQSVQSMRLTGLVDELNSAAVFARSEAIKRSRRVIMCRANDARNGCTLEGGNWSNGWLIFVDATASDTAAPTYEAANLLRVSDRPPAGSTVTGRTGATTRGWVRYTGIGTLARAASSTARFSWDVSLTDTTLTNTLQIGLAGRTNLCKGSLCE